MYEHDPRERGLEVKVVDGLLTISIGVGALCQAVEMGYQQAMDPIKITDHNTFVDEMVGQLNFEEDDGSTIIHSMFDLAAERAIHDGSEAVEVREDK